MGYIEELRALVGHRPLVLGGTVEPGESLEETARRELREELGLGVEELTFFRSLSGPEFYAAFPNGDEVYYVGAAYLGRGLVGAVRPDPAEVAAWRYFDPFALPAPLAPCGGVILRWYVESLERRESPHSLGEGGTSAVTR